MPFDRALWPSAAAITRVLDATGRQHIPADLDIAELRADLNQCRAGILAKQIDTAEFRGSYKKAAAETIKHALGLRSLLQRSGNGLFDRQLRFALDPGDHEYAIALLETIALAADKIASQPIDMIDTPGGPKYYLVRLLAPIYERHFKRSAGREGPFSRFGEAVSAEMGRSIRVSHHTIRKSLAAQHRGDGG
jgi:hypothetical protein